MEMTKNTDKLKERKKTTHALKLKMQMGMYAEEENVICRYVRVLWISQEVSESKCNGLLFASIYGIRHVQSETLPSEREKNERKKPSNVT